MRLDFEQWISQKRFSTNVTKLFNESVTSYKHSAYRASLLFSYLSFITIIKENIIKSPKPVHLPQGRWDDTIRRLQSDDTWEATVFQELTNSSSPIFPISEDIRQQVKYWKDRRNDCAHFKSNEIESHHVESLWSFIKSNLSKITIEGGKENLLNKFERHFDPTFTPPNADFEHLVREIDDTVLPAELGAFWVELLERIDDFGIYFFSGSPSVRVVGRILRLCNGTTIESLVSFLKQNQHDLSVLGDDTTLISYFQYTAEEVRGIWHNRIWHYKPKALAIYAILLRNDLIPREQIREAHERVIAMIAGYSPDSDEIHVALSGGGFGETLFDIAIHQQRLNDWYHWVNPRADLLAYYIERYPLHEETVEVICEMYARSRYSHWLGERIEKIFADSHSKKTEFHQIAERRGFTIPPELAL